MNNDLHRKILDTMQRHGMLRPGDRIGLGVSGGADSVAMLRLFAEMRARLGVTLLVLHFHHQLRAAAADGDQDFVRALAEKFSLQFVSGCANVAAEARLHGWNLEDAARRLRYRFFSATAETHALQRVAVAHTANDQAETVLAHLLRGTGLTGLSGIHPVSGLVVRPLLDVPREELRDYLSGLGQDWREDASNQDTTRTRARIRHQLIPVLLRDFEPAAVTRLARLAKHAREDEAFWRALEDERFAALAVRENRSTVSVEIANLLSPWPVLDSARNASPSGETSRSTPSFAPSTIALTRRLIRRLYAELRGRREQLTSRHVDDVLRLALKSQSGARIELPGLGVERTFGRLSFVTAPASAEAKLEREAERATTVFAYTVSRPEPRAPSCIVVAEIKRRFNLKVVDWPPARSDTVEGWGALDFDRICWPLVLRNWRPGDSYRPHGSRRARKLKRLLLESRVPQSARGGWPVLTSGGQVIWAFGYPVAAEVAPSPETRTGLMIGEAAFRAEEL